MDAAEQWLQEHDPAYPVTSRSWRHITSGEYVGPWQEVPAGDATDLAKIAANRELAGHPPLEGSHKLCTACGDPFAPMRVGHVHCSPRCRKRAQRRRALAELTRLAEESEGGYR